MYQNILYQITHDIIYLGTENAQVWSPMVEVDHEQWEGGDHHHA